MTSTVSLNSWAASSRTSSRIARSLPDVLLHDRVDLLLGRYEVLEVVLDILDQLAQELVGRLVRTRAEIVAPEPVGDAELRRVLARVEPAQGGVELAQDRRVVRLAADPLCERLERVGSAGCGRPRGTRPP